MHPFTSLHFAKAIACTGTLLLQSAFGQSDGQPPRQNQPGPWDQDVHVYRVTSSREAEKLATFERAGVPNIAKLKDGRLMAAFQNFPADDTRNFDRVAVRFSSDDGRTWSKAEPIVVAEMEAGLARPFDPTIVALPDGRIRLYFTSNRSADFRRSTPAIYSAISPDGIHYTFEPGTRFAIDGRIAIDCAAALHDGVFHLIVPDNGTAEDFVARPGKRPPPGGNGYHATSKDGLQFERVADVKLSSDQSRWLGGLHSDGKTLYFFGTGAGPWPVTSTDGVKWEAPTSRIPVPGADPGAVKISNAEWMMIVTGAPRPGTPSATRRAGAGPPKNKPVPNGPPPTGQPAPTGQDHSSR